MSSLRGLLISRFQQLFVLPEAIVLQMSKISANKKSTQSIPFSLGPPLSCFPEFSLVRTCGRTHMGQSDLHAGGFEVVLNNAHCLLKRRNNLRCIGTPLPCPIGTLPSMAVPPQFTGHHSGPTFIYICTLARSDEFYREMCVHATVALAMLGPWDGHLEEFNQKLEYFTDPLSYTLPDFNPPKLGYLKTQAAAVFRM